MFTGRGPDPVEQGNSALQVSVGITRLGKCLKNCFNVISPRAGGIEGGLKPNGCRVKGRAAIVFVRLHLERRALGWARALRCGAQQEASQLIPTPKLGID